MNHLRVFVLFVAGLISGQVSAYSEPCQLVAQMVDSKLYKQQPQRMASMASPGSFSAEIGLTLLESHGAWHIYQTPAVWMGKEQCAPLTKTFGEKRFLFMPVLLNKESGHNAVITGTFIVKVYRKQHWDRVIQKYGFKVLSPLPSPKAMIVDVKPTDSYDLLIRRLDKDKDVVLALPLLSEPRR